MKNNFKNIFNKNLVLKYLVLGFFLFTTVSFSIANPLLKHESQVWDLTFLSKDYSDFELKKIQAYLNSNLMKLDLKYKLALKMSSQKILVSSDKFNKDSMINNEIIFFHLDELLIKSILNQSKLFLEFKETQKTVIEKIKSQIFSNKLVSKLYREYTNEEKKDFYLCHRAHHERSYSALKLKQTMKKRCRELKNLKRIRKKFRQRLSKLSFITKKVPVQIDYSSFGQGNLKNYQICETVSNPTKVLKNGKKIKMLGASIVYMGPGFDSSVVGHVAQRFIYCLDNRLVDILFDYTQMTQAEADYHTKMSKVVRNIDRDYSEYIGSLFIKIIHDPGNSLNLGYGVGQTYANRDIIEFWLNSDERQLYKHLKENLSSYKEQKKSLENHNNLQEYSLTKKNCIEPVLKTLKSEFNTSLNWITKLTPQNILSYLLKKDFKKIIIYPSQKLFREIQKVSSGTDSWIDRFIPVSDLFNKNPHHSQMAFYQKEESTFIEKLFQNPIFGLTNLLVSSSEFLWGLLSLPVDLFRSENKAVKHITTSTQGLGLSLLEIFSLNLRYPAPSEWTEEEIKIIQESFDLYDPAVLSIL